MHCQPGSLLRNLDRNTSTAQCSCQMLKCWHKCMCMCVEEVRSESHKVAKYYFGKILFTFLSHFNILSCSNIERLSLSIYFFSFSVFHEKLNYSGKRSFQALTFYCVWLSQLIISWVWSHAVIVFYISLTIPIFFTFANSGPWWL